MGHIIVFRRGQKPVFSTRYDIYNDEFYKRIWSEIKRTRLKIITDKKARNREKIAAILSFGGEKLLKKSWRSKMSIRKGGI